MHRRRSNGDAPHATIILHKGRQKANVRAICYLEYWGRLGDLAAVVVSWEVGARGRNPSLWIVGIMWMPSTEAPFVQRWPIFGQCPVAIAWLELQTNLGLAPRTLEAYARGVAD